jgi:hypothetical protein
VVRARPRGRQTEGRLGRGRRGCLGDEPGHLRVHPDQIRDPENPAGVEPPLFPVPLPQLSDP